LNIPQARLFIGKMKRKKPKEDVIGFLIPLRGHIPSTKSQTLNKKKKASKEHKPK